MKKLTSLLVLLVVVSCNRSSDDIDSSSSRIDSLFNAAQRSPAKAEFYLKTVDSTLKLRKNDSITRYKYLVLSWYYLDRKNSERSFEASKRAFDLASEARDNYTLAYSANSIADIFYYAAEYDSAYYYYIKAEKAGHSSGGLNLASVKIGKSRILSFKKDNAGAESEAVDGLRLALKSGDHWQIQASYEALGNALLGLNNPDKALVYYNKALKELEYLPSDSYSRSHLALKYNYITIAYQKKGDHKTAIKYAQMGLRLTNLRNTDIKTYSYLLNNLAYSKFKIGDQTALPLFYKALRISDSINNKFTQSSVHVKLAEYYLQMRELDSAKSNAIAAQAIAHKNLIFEDELTALQLLGQISPEEATAHNERYIHLSDSLQDVERATRNKYARLEFETDEIVSEKEMVEAERDRISLQRWMILGFGLLLLSIIVLVFINKAQRAKNKELEYVRNQLRSKEEIYQLIIEQQQKIEEGKQLEKRRISQELHDGVMGRLNSIRLNLFILSKKTDPETINKCLAHINDIQSIEKEIRAISHDLNTNIFAANIDFINIVENLFSSIRNHSDIQFKLVVDDQIDWLAINSNIKVQIYRILQEALQNIDKYAGAANVKVQMKKDDYNLIIEISDDGVGFDTTANRQGIGIKNMHDRIREVGGNMILQSESNSGTKINLTIPL
ncbi:MAG TPA: ATP-binding protein [Flavobacterium sp.]